MHSFTPVLSTYPEMAEECANQKHQHYQYTETV